MTANYIPNPTVGPSNGAAMTDFASRMIQQITAQKDQQQAQQAAQQDAYDRSMASQFLKLPADQQQNNLSRLTDGARKYILDTNGFMQHTPTADENLHAGITGIGQGYVDHPDAAPSGWLPNAAYQNATGTAAPAAQVASDIRRDTLGRPNQNPQIVAAQRIADQLDPTGQQNAQNAQADRKFNQIDMPTSQANIGHINAETGENNARTGLVGAQTQNEILKRNATSPLSPGYQSPTGLDGAVPDVKQKVAITLQNPQNYWLDTKKGQADQQAVMNGLGIAPPQRPDTITLRQYRGTLNGLQLADQIDAIRSKWASRGYAIDGLLGGLVNTAGGKINANLMGPALANVPAPMRNEYRSDVKQTLENLTALPIQEAAALTDTGRPAAQTIQMLRDASAKLASEPQEFNGAMAGYRQRLATRRNVVEQQIWGGKVPDPSLIQRLTGEAPQQTTAPTGSDAVSQFLSKHGIGQ